MTRSNGPAGQPGRNSDQGADQWPELTDQQRADAGGRPAAPQAGQPQAGEWPQGYPAPPQQQGAPGYHLPQQPRHTAPPVQGHPQTQTQPPVRSGAASGPDYSQQFDRYAPPPSQRTQPPPQQQHGKPQHQDPSFGHAPQQQGGYVPQQAGTEPGFEQRGTIHDHAPHVPQGHDPQWQQPAPQQNYDLGHYMPAPGAAAAGQTYGASQQTGGHHGHDAHGYPAQGYHPQHGHQPSTGYGGPPMGQDGYRQDGYQQDGYQSYGDQGPHGVDEEYDVDEHDYDEPKGGKRGLLIAAALVGAIGIGGGLAYGYKYLGGGGQKLGAGDRIIRADSKPVKSRPDDPGGKRFANSGTAVLNQGAGAQEDRIRSSSGGNPNTLKVTTLNIKKDGTVSAPAAAPTQPADGARLEAPSVVVPGMSLDFGPSRPPRRVEVPAQPTQPERQVAAAAVQAPARVVSPTVQPTARALPKPVPLAKAPPPRRQKPQVLAAVPPSRVGAGAGGGYVAWISSSKDRVRSLGEFATLQQKHSAILAGKQPEIQQKDVKDKGTWYRLRIGPPGSKAATKALCDQLLAAKGVRQCFVSRF